MNSPKSGDSGDSGDSGERDDDVEADAEAVDNTPPPVAPTFLLRARRMVIGAGVAVLLIGLPIATRVAWDGRAELELADQAAEAGDFEGELVHLGRAARWRMPLLGHDDEAIDRLITMGDEAARMGEEGRADALAAYREARRALLATRTFSIPRPDVFAYANESIATLMAEQEERFGTDVGGTGDPKAYHLGLLEAVPGPDPVRANFAALAFGGWLLACGGFIVRSIDAKGILRKRSAVRWGLLSIVLLIAWTMLLRFA